MSPALALLLLSLAAPTAAPNALEAAFLADAADRRLDHHELLDAALLASGAQTGSQLRSARDQLRAALEAVEAGLDRKDPRAASQLLKRLHRGAPGAEPLLREYETHATSLLDVLDGGRFNCVSATLLYLVAARDLGLDVRAVLLPSHARADVVLGRKRHLVETTSPNGFDAPPEVAQEIQRRFRQPQGSVDLYGDERGTEVDDLALLGVVYSNRSAMAKLRGDLPLSDSLDARADRLVAPSARPLLRRVRASTLGELAVRRLSAGEVAPALELALQAAQLVPPGKDAELALHNLKAIGQRRLDELAKAGDEKAMLALPERFKAFPSVHRELRAWALDLAGLERAKRGDHPGAVAAAREALELGSGSTNLEVLAHNFAVAELNRLGALAETDPDAAWAQWSGLEVPRELRASRERLGGNIALVRAQRALEARRCRDVDERVAEAARLAPEVSAARLRGSCRNDVGLAHWKAGDFLAAAASFREAVSLEPGEPAFRKNLVGSLQNHLNGLLKQRRCADASPLIAEGSRLDPSNPLFLEALQYCASL